MADIKKTPEEKRQEYWLDRFSQIEDARHEAASVFVGRVQEAVREAVVQINADIAKWTERIAKNNEVSLTEAKRLLKADELKEFKWDVEQYINAGRQMAVDGSWMKELENASAKFHITRLEALKMDVRNSVEQLFTKENAIVNDAAQKAYLDGYYKTIFELQKGIGVGWNVAAIDRTALEAVIHRPWAADRLNFSDRIWNNKTKVINELYSQMTRNILLGRPPGDGVKALMKLAKDEKRSESDAARLIYTESAYFGTISELAAFEALDVEAVEFVATLDDKTSDECRDMDGVVMKIRDVQPGINAPPLHPWCRSCLAPAYEELAGIGERWARDPETGKGTYIPAGMKYNEWKKRYVDGE